MMRYCMTMGCAIVLAGTVIANAQSIESGEEKSQCGDETLVWEACDDGAKACYKTSYKGLAGRVWFQTDFSPAQPFYFKLDDRNFQNWVASAELARDGLCRLLVETSEKPLDINAGDEELRKALGLPQGRQPN